MSLQDIPQELTVLPQWVGALEDKTPINPRTGYAASVDNPQTWSTFQEACYCGTPYVGFVFTRNDPYTFIDLDTYKHPACQELHYKIVTHANSYTETSHSGGGSHIVVRASLDTGYRDDSKGIEIYPHGRYMLTTGQRYYGNGIVDGQELVNYLVDLINSNRFVVSELTTAASNKTDAEVYAALASAENGDKFVALWSGNWRHYTEYYNDHSRADLALLTFLDFYTQDVDQVVRLFKASALYRTEKGKRSGDGTDYILRTLKSARSRNNADRKVLANIDALVDQANQVAAAAKQPPYQTAGYAEQHPDFIEDTNIKAIDELTLPPGLVGELALYIYQAATRPVKEVALLGALTLMAGIVGRQYNVVGTGLNLYLILLAPTGSGKEGAASGISLLMSKVREKVPSILQFVGPADFASGQGLIKSLVDQPCFYSIVGEFGLRLQTLADARANSAEKTLQRALLNLYTKSGWAQYESSMAYSNRENNTKTVFAPALTLLGESTPELFYSHLNENHISSGLLPRFIMLEYDGKRPGRNTHTQNMAPPEHLVTRLCEVAATAMQMQANNSCADVAFDHTAEAMLDQFDKFADKQINKGNEVHKQLWNRAHLKALRLAGVIAVGVNPLQPIITEEVAQWSIDLIKRDITTISKKFEQQIVGGGERVLEQEIRRVVEEFFNMTNKQKLSYSTPEGLLDTPVVPYAFLRRRLRMLAAFNNGKLGLQRTIENALADLCEAGVLELIPKQVMQERYSSRAKCYCVGESWKA